MKGLTQKHVVAVVWPEEPNKMQASDKVLNTLRPPPAGKTKWVSTGSWWLQHDKMLSSPSENRGHMPQETAGQEHQTGGEKQLAGAGKGRLRYK